MKTIAKVCIMFAVCFQSVAGIVEWTPENRQWENREIELWKQKFAESEKMAPFEKLEHLELGLKNMGHRLGMNGHNPGIDVICKKIQSNLLFDTRPRRIPPRQDRRTHYSISPSTGGMEKDRNRPKLNGKHIGLLLGELDRARIWSLQTLKELPSPETLRVLGEMLNDERMLIKLLPDKSNWEAVQMTATTSEVSAYTLRQMIENPPTTGDFVYGRDMPVWHNWWRQVKEGRRTVRFKGDPQEYGFNGPVSKALNPDLPRAPKRPGIQETPVPQPSKPDSSSVPWIAALLVLGGWLAFRKSAAR